MNLRLLISGILCLAVVLTVGTAQAQLVAFYEFDGNHNDSSGNAYHGSGGSNWGTGNRGSALDVAGSGGNYSRAPVWTSPGIAPKVTFWWLGLSDGWQPLPVDHPAGRRLGA
jgi:hypothetical protein